MLKRSSHHISKENYFRAIMIPPLVVFLLLGCMQCATPKLVGGQRPLPPSRMTGEAEYTVTQDQTDQPSQPDESEQLEQPGQQEQLEPDPHLDGRWLELPFYSDSTFIVHHPEARYTLCYDTMYRQATWVAYLLTRAEVEYKGTERTNVFRCDPEVVSRGWPTAYNQNYTHSGYDRGHLLPSADRNNTPSENKATFYLSNVSPQYAGLNRRIWLFLEEQVRQWAAEYDSLYVVTGPELRPGLPQINGGVGVPPHYFKALLVWHEGRYHAIAFLIPNEEQMEGVFMDYALSVDDLEQRLDCDFFWRLPDDVEERVEGEVDRTFWKDNWNAHSTHDSELSTSD